MLVSLQARKQDRGRERTRKAEKASRKQKFSGSQTLKGNFQSFESILAFIFRVMSDEQPVLNALVADYLGKVSPGIAKKFQVGVCLFDN